MPHPRTYRRIAAAVALTALAASAAGCPRPGPGPTPAPAYADSLTEPLVIRSMNGVLSVTLDVVFADLPVTRAGKAIVADTVAVTDSIQVDTLPLRAYRIVSTTDTAYAPNDPRFTARYPGPTFRVRPGDLVQIKLRNRLPPPATAADSNTVCMSYPAANTGQDVFQDCFHGPNFTNIHYHGMHVTPDSSWAAVGDDVLMVIAPGDSILYSFRIPTNQSPGTHWYHPHKHGSVALQVANGMAGAFIVEDPTTGIDRFTVENGLREHLIAFQQIDTIVGLFHGDQTNILDKVPPLVNGQDFPTIYMAPGELQRWRIVNENVTRNTKTLEFSFQDRPGEEPVMVEVARDGVQFAPVNIAVNTDTVLQMAAGNRLDVFVMAPFDAGEHYFRVRHNPGASRRTRAAVLPLQTLASPDRRQLDDSTAFVLFRVVVDPSRQVGSAAIMPRGIASLAAHLAPRIPGPPAFLGGNLPPARDTVQVLFTDTGQPGSYLSPPQFYIGSVAAPFQKFNDTVVFVPTDAGNVPMPMYLDSIQTWRVVNNSAVGVNHPFHIHINPFQVNRVVAPNPQDPFLPLYAELNHAAETNNAPIWLDVVPLPIPAVDSAGNPIPNSAYVVITQRYDGFQGCTDEKCGSPLGAFVMHCHILGHEERGMMQVIEVIEPGQTTSRARLRGHRH